MAEKIHYFRPVKGKVCRRFGSEAFIGASRSPTGYIINTDAVVAITDIELAPYRKDYASYIRHGDLVKATKSEYTTWQNKRKKATEAAVAARKKKAAPKQPDIDNNDSESVISDESGAAVQVTHE